MEVSHAVLRPLPSISGALFDSRSVKCSLSCVSIDAGCRSSADLRLLGSRDPTDSVRPTRFSGTLTSGFSDAGHLRYYVSPRSGGKKEMEARNVKKKLKLIKGLTKDLSAFSAMGFDVEAEDGLIGENKGKNISEAAEILLAQLKLLRAEEKELKRKKKEEKAILKATRMKARVDCEESSSSSSESSDGECEKVVDMSCLRSEALTQSKSDEGREPMASSLGPAVVVRSRVETEGIDDQSIQNGRGEICSGIGASSSTVSVVNSKKDQKGLGLGASAERIEVCMGGKCKKSGAAALLEEFQSRVGMEGAVVGCKCMGKCRDGPNVRVLSQVEEGGMNGSVTSPKNPLCIGVGLEDVHVIVSNFLGEDRKDMGLMAAV